jgi:hypothetical protein
VSRTLPVLLALLGAVSVLAGIGSARGSSNAPAAPPFPGDPARWIGTPPTWDSLRGQVVLLDVWTFG